MLLYSLKRLLLMVPTLLGVLFLTFVVIQFVPGGPVEQYLAEAKAGAGSGAEGGLSYRGAQGVDPKRIEQALTLAKASSRTAMSPPWCGRNCQSP
jgi:microcin C transport system permease protein